MSGPEITGATYGVELLFDGDYDLASPGLHAELRARCPSADVQPERGPIVLFHRDAPIQLKDSLICAQTVILGTDSAVASAQLEPALQQTRDWPAVREIVARAKRQVLVTDLMSSSLPAPRRLEVFQRALAAVVSAMRPRAIAWTAAGKLVDPARFLEAMDSRDPSDRLFLALNVRMFSVGNRPGESVMDTMGLASLGLPDLQVHSMGLEPDDVARHLFNSAYYLLEKGDVIADGQTIDGIPRGTKWRCQHEASLVGPSRVVLDIDPGPPFAAGNRRSGGAPS
ncbi:hypothetical protein BH11MYX4_BH11MYX4_24470 [soil metagenome]